MAVKKNVKKKAQARFADQPGQVKVTAPKVKPKAKTTTRPNGDVIVELVK